MRFCMLGELPADARPLADAPGIAENPSEPVEAVDQIERLDGSAPSALVLPV
jgi:hypothetical protein